MGQVQRLGQAIESRMDELLRRQSSLERSVSESMKRRSKDDLRRRSEILTALERAVRGGQGPGQQGPGSGSRMSCSAKQQLSGSVLTHHKLLAS